MAVFGSSEPREGDPLYQEAVRVGSEIAARGWRVVTGGYGGVMEGASRGARERGGVALGVICEIFRDREPNRYLSETIGTADLHERTRALVEIADAYVVLWGKSGTLAEAALVWALHRAGCLRERPVLLLGAPWERLFRQLAESGMLEGPELRVTRLARTPEEVVRILAPLLARRGDSEERWEVGPDSETGGSS